MAQLPPAVEQVLRVHAAFIHTVVNALRDRSQLPELMKQLDAAEQAGWARLVGALRHVIDGRRDPSIKLGLDEEDGILLDAILRGLAATPRSSSGWTRKTASCSMPSCAGSTTLRPCRLWTPARTAAPLPPAWLR